MILWRVGFTVLLSYNIYSYRKNLLDCTNLFFPNDYKKNYKIVMSTLKTNMACLDFTLKTDETRNYLLEGIKYDLMI